MSGAIEDVAETVAGRDGARWVLAALTPRQGVLARLLAAGWNVSDAAREVGISRAWVYVELHAMRARLAALGMAPATQAAQGRHMGEPVT